MLVHFVAHAQRGTDPLARPRAAGWLWRRLRARFPDAVAVVLMPDHLHLVADAPDPTSDRHALARILGHAQRRSEHSGTHATWARVPEPATIPDRHHLKRQVRYLALNPCRSKLVRDPLAWPWSTHRDAIGAVIDPWIDAARMAALLRHRRRGFEEGHHAYVSSDPCVDVTGTSFPEAAPQQHVAARSVSAILAAARASSRGSVQRTRADFIRLVAALAKHQGWRDATPFAAALDVSPRTMRRHLAAASLDPPRAALLCLGDARLSGPFRSRSGQSRALS